jgi:hypothetical protein
MRRRSKRSSDPGTTDTPSPRADATEALDVDSPAYVIAGQCIRCPRCGDVHTLTKRDRTPRLYVVCGGDVVPAANEHWLDPTAFGEVERVIDLTDDSGEPRTTWELREAPEREPADQPPTRSL